MLPSINPKLVYSSNPSASGYIGFVFGGHLGLNIPTLPHKEPSLENGRVVCRVFNENYHQRASARLRLWHWVMMSSSPILVPGSPPIDHKKNPRLMKNNFPSFNPTMQLPQLMSNDQPVPTILPSQPGIARAMSSLEVECSKNLMKLTLNSGDGMLHAADAAGGVDHFAETTDWLILDKLLASHQNLYQLFHSKITAASSSSMAPYHQQLMELNGSSFLQRLPLQYLSGEQADLLRFPK